MMAMQKTPQEKVQHVFGERLKSLLEDGYVVRVKSESPTLLFVRLKHMTNGNEIRLFGYPEAGFVEQYTNKLKKYLYTL